MQGATIKKGVLYIAGTLSGSITGLGMVALFAHDRVAFIVDGQIAAIDSPAALRHRFGRREVEVRWEGTDGESTGNGAERFSLDGLADNPAFLDALRRDGLTTIHSLEATLEDVFVQVTGRSLQ